MDVNCPLLRTECQSSTYNLSKVTAHDRLNEDEVVQRSFLCKRHNRHWGCLDVFGVDAEKRYNVRVIKLRMSDCLPMYKLEKLE